MLTTTDETGTPELSFTMPLKVDDCAKHTFTMNNKKEIVLIVIRFFIFNISQLLFGLILNNNAAKVKLFRTIPNNKSHVLKINQQTIDYQ